MALKFAVNNSLSAVTTLPTAIPTGALSLIQTQTASSSASVQFTTGIDDTYDSYVFKFYNIHLASDDKTFAFQGSTNGGSSYGITTTNSRFIANHKEDDSSSTLLYTSNQDLAQSTTYINIGHGVGADTDQNVSGTLKIFNPSSDTFVKHYIGSFNNSHASNRSDNFYIGGYFNTTSPINAFSFEGRSIAGDGGITTPAIDIESGTIKMYGVK